MEIAGRFGQGYCEDGAAVNWDGEDYGASLNLCGVGGGVKGVAAVENSMVVPQKIKNRKYRMIQ